MCIYTGFLELKVFPSIWLKILIIIIYDTFVFMLVLLISTFFIVDPQYYKLKKYK